MPLPKLLLPALLATALTAQDAPWLGTWKLSSAPDIVGAIERCTAEMSFITRPIARSRLKKLNPAYQRVIIARSGAEFTLQFDERQPIRIPADGKAAPWTREDGEKFMVSAQVTAEGLRQHYQGEDGDRTNLFRTNGQALTLEVTVKSSRLPKPLSYTLAFTR